MPETTTGLRSALSQPWVYSLAQVIMGAQRGRRLLAQRYIRAQPGYRILDLGCGTAEILDHLPADLHYTGYDVSEEYLEAARARYPQHTFKLGALPDTSDTDYDLVLVIGVLHHLEDVECRNLLVDARARLKPGGRIVTLDPLRRGNPIEAAMYALDRGRNIRGREAYIEIARSAGVEPQVCTAASDIGPPWLPYTYFIMEL
jgi:2-polyprenyl-3-methyl-5-hydroxy-6-metoxy-1,4-benzoquinol methylase